MKRVPNPSKLLKLGIIIICLGILLTWMPVNYLSISDGSETLYASPLPNGASFLTTYIHSVQLTPVIDDYRIASGMIWSWEERVQSHNAGLPFDAPPHGRFLIDSPWMIVQGGRHRLETIAYRVGTEQLGKNHWHLPPFSEIEAYKLYPKARVFLGASIVRLKDAPLIGFTP